MSVVWHSYCSQTVNSLLWNQFVTLEMTWQQHPAMKSNWYLRHLDIVLLYAYIASYFLFIQHKHIPELFIISSSEYYPEVILVMWYAIPNYQPYHLSVYSQDHPNPHQETLFCQSFHSIVCHKDGILWQRYGFTIEGWKHTSVSAIHYHFDKRLEINCGSCLDMIQWLTSAAICGDALQPCVACFQQM